MFTRLSHCLFAALLFTLNASAAETAATGSLLPDGSFETDANSDGWPDGWGRPKSGGSWQEESGNHFLRLTSGTPGEMVMLYQQVQIPARREGDRADLQMAREQFEEGKADVVRRADHDGFQGRGGEEAEGCARAEYRQEHGRLGRSAA